MPPADERNLTDAFRKLYFHLYTNGQPSRAERIVEDLSLLLLAKLSAGRALSRYAAGEGTADALLLPALRRAHPDLVEDGKRFALGDPALRGALETLDGVDLAHASGHVLGDAFQALIGPRLRGDKGQFFTPRSLVRAVVGVVAPSPGESLVDPACGTGGFLVEARASSRGAGATVGVDKDADLARLAGALLRVACGRRAEVRAANSLDLAAWRGEEFDVVLTNPPFGARIGVTDPAILAQYELGRGAGSQDPQVLFLELGVRLLRAGGRMAIVLPEGVFGNKRQGQVWDFVRAHGRITALLDCPRTTFQPGTDAKTNVLFFEKTKRRARPVRIAVALHCGHDRRGRATLPDGRAHPDDFEGLARDYHSPRPSRWHDVALASSRYLVPRYHVKRAPLGARERALTAGAKRATLGELRHAGVLTVRKGHEVGSQAYGTGDVPFVRTSDVSNFEVRADPTKSVSEEIYARYAPQQRLAPGDVLMVVDGRYRIGQVAILDAGDHRCVVQSHFRILGTPRRDDLEPYELLYALSLPSVQTRVRDLVFVQSTLGTLGDRLFELEVPLLQGDGPWRAAVAAFRSALVERSRLLRDLQRVPAAEVEL